MSYDNLAEKAAKAEKRKAQDQVENMIKYGVLPVVLILMVVAPTLMFLNNAGYRSPLFVWGKLAVILEFVISALALVGAGYVLYGSRKWKNPVLLSIVLLAVSILFLVFAFIGCANNTFSKDDWKKTESGLYYVMEEGGIHIKGIDSGVSSVTIEEEYDFFPVKKIDISVGKGDALEHLVVKLGDFVDTDFSFKKTANLKTVAFEGGEISLRRTFKKCTSLQSVSFVDCQASLSNKAFSDSYLLSFTAKNSTVRLGANAFFETGIADLYAEDSIICSTGGEYIPCVPFSDSTLSRVSLKNSTLKEIWTDIGTLALDGVCHVALTKDHYSGTTMYFSDLTVRSLILEEGFNAEESTLSYVRNKYIDGIFTDPRLNGTDYFPVSTHIYVPAEVTKLPNALFGDQLSEGSPAVTVHYGGSEEAWQAVTAGAENNALFTGVAVRYNETCDNWAK